MEIIDISVPVHNDMPTWPSSIGVEISDLLRISQGDPANTSRLDCDVHTGTHVDAPAHFIEGGRANDALSLNVLVGPCQVVCIPDAVTTVTANVLTECIDATGEQGPPRRLLLRTSNSKWWEQRSHAFRTDFVGLDPDAARWVVEQGIDLIGVDYLSVQPFDGSPETHTVLLENDVIILEGIDLSGVEARQYELTCLPLRLIGTDGAPARAILRPLSDETAE